MHFHELRKSDKKQKVYNQVNIGKLYFLQDSG